MNNLGTIGSPAIGITYWTNSVLKNIDAINLEYYNFKYVYGVRKSATQSLGNSYLTAKQKTWEMFVLWQNAIIEPNGVFTDGTNYYKVSKANDSTEEQKSSLTNAQKQILKSTIAATQVGYKYLDNGTKKDLIINIKSDSKPTVWSGQKLVREYGYLQDYLFVYENNGAVKFNNTGAKAYGLIKTNNGTISGEFTEKYDYLLEE